MARKYNTVQFSTYSADQVRVQYIEVKDHTVQCRAVQYSECYVQ